MIESPNPKDLETCAFCPKLCRAVCPVAEVEKRETVTPWGLMGALHAQSHGQSVLSGEGAEILYHCTGCRRCQQHCQDHVAVPESIMGGRAQAFERGDAPEAAEALAEGFKVHGNPYGHPLSSTAQAAFGPTSGAGRDGALFADCQTVARYPEHLGAARRVFDALGLSLTLPPSTVDCCGAPLYHAGDAAAFKAHAQKVHRALKDAPSLTVTSPGCAHLLKDVYPTLGLKWSGPVTHVSERVGAQMDALPVSPGGRPMPTVYQDPCHLARSLGVTRAPRALIEKATGAAPREPFYSGARAQCTGGGGGMPAILPEVAAKVANQALGALAPQPGERVVTACPGCKRRLERAGCAAPVSDLMEVLDRALQGPRSR